VYLFLPKKLRRKILTHEPIMYFYNTVLSLIILVVVYTIAHAYVEKVSLFEAFWLVFQSLTTIGYGDIPAQTTIGRIVTMGCAFFGVFTLACCVDRFYVLRGYIKDMKEGGQMPNKMKDSYIIINFFEARNLTIFIEQIRHSEPKAGICIIDESLEALPIEISRHPNIHFVKGSAIDIATLKKANVQEAKRVIVLPKAENPEVDAITQTTVQLVRRIGGKDLKIIHMIIDPKNSYLFDGMNSVEILENMEFLAMVQECQDQYSAVAIQKLLYNSQGANPKTFKPNKIIGMSWKDFTTKGISVADKLGLNVNIFAMVNDGCADTCPPLNTIINKDDFIILLASNGFNWDQFEEGLAAAA
jgi:voltage-gated potassium channel